MSGYGIYPKQYRNALLPIEKNRCFILMPFHEDHDMIYGEIKKTLSQSNFSCNRADEIFGSVPIMGTVLKEILRAHFIIADLTGQNANVFYELGIAHSFKDAHNIILISQSIDDVPFDIRHLGAIIYDKENLKYLTSSIKKTLSENFYYYEFFEALQKSKIISVIHSDMDDFVEKIALHMGRDLQIITLMLNGRGNNFANEDVRRILDVAIGILYSNSFQDSRNFLNGVLRMLGVLIANLRENPYTLEVLRHLLFELRVEKFPLGREEIIHMQTQLAVQVASERAFINETLTWIISYFSRSKSATIDLNRYHLERFLLTSVDNEVDVAIVNAVLHENYYVREHMADIVGEKKIVAGVETLIVQLRRESSIYATASIITALGKLGRIEAYAPLKEWFLKNEENIINTKHFFVLKHLYLAMINIGISDLFINEFRQKFSEHISSQAMF